MGQCSCRFSAAVRMKTVFGLLLLATVACLGADQHVDEKTMSPPYEAPLKKLVTQSLPRWGAITGPQPNERMGPQPNGVNGPPPYDGMSPQPNGVNGPLRCFPFCITNFLESHLLDLVAVLLLYVNAGLLWFIGADQPVQRSTHRLDGPRFALVAYLPRLLLALHGVAVLLGLLWSSLRLHLTDFLGLEVTVLLLYREGMDVRDLLAVFMNISLAHLHLYLSGYVVTLLRWFPGTYHTLRPISIILCPLVPLAVELHRVGAGDIVYNLFLHVAVGGLHIDALVVILRSPVNVIDGVADSVHHCQAALDLISLLECLVVYDLFQVAHQFIDIETYTLDMCHDYCRAVFVRMRSARLLSLSPTCPLCIRLALVPEYNLLLHVAVGLVVDTVSPHISLPDVRSITHEWRWKSQHCSNPDDISNEGIPVHHSDFEPLLPM